MPEIELTFEFDGKTVHKEAKGFTGKSCTEKTGFIDDALGKPREHIYKSEYYEEENENEEQDRIQY